MTSEVIITRPVWEEYRRIKPRLRNQALAALIDYLMTGEKPAFSRNINTPFNQLLVTYKESTETLHSSRTHLALISHSSQEEEKQKKASSPCTPILKEEEKEEERLILPTSELAARDTAETAIEVVEEAVRRLTPLYELAAAEHSPSWGRWRGLPPSHPRRSLPPRGSERLQLRPRRLFQPLRIERLARGTHKNEKLAFGLYLLGTQPKNLWKLPTIYLCNAPRRRPPSWPRNCPRRHPPNCQQSLLNSNGATPLSRHSARP